MSLYDDNRASWGAAPNTWTAAQAAANTVPPAQRLGISYHHPGGTLRITPASPHSACLSQVKAWQYEHQHGNGWADIGYNGLVCQHARVIEGRGFDLKGAHSPGVNWTHYGVQFMVSLTGGDTPTPAMYARAVRLRAELEARSGHALREWGHRDDPQASTICPGDPIEAWIHAGGPYATTTTQETDMQLDDTVHLWTGQEVDYSEPTTTVEGILRSTNYYVLQSRNALAAQLTALSAAVDALASSHGLDPAATQDIIRTAVRDALAGLSVTLTAPTPPAPAPAPAPGA